MTKKSPYKRQKEFKLQVAKNVRKWITFISLANLLNFVSLYQDVCFECHDKHRWGYQKLVRETGGKIVQA